MKNSLLVKTAATARSEMAKPRPSMATNLFRMYPTTNWPNNFSNTDISSSLEQFTKTGSGTRQEFRPLSAYVDFRKLLWQMNLSLFDNLVKSK